MDSMNDLRGIDLNLLVVLEALLEEAHVTRAARRLNLSQPAASNALDRLRNLFGDPLLERGPGGMRPTPIALALRQPLRAALTSVRAVLDRPGTDLATVCRTVRLLLADAPATALAAALHARLAREAPGVTLAILPWRGAEAAVAQLARNEVDLVASVLPTLDPPLRQRPLLEERYRVVMRRDHPAAEGFDLDAWLTYPHLVVSGRGATATTLDAALAARGLSRRVGLVVPSFLMVPPLLLGSSLIAMLPSRCIPPAGAMPLAALPPPLPVTGFRLDLAWHDRHADDPVIQHVGQAMAEALPPNAALPAA
jgi:DNA-binding transcriptional LysR family regulator